MSALIVGQCSQEGLDRLASGFATYMNRVQPEFRWQPKRREAGPATVTPAGEVAGTGAGREDDNAAISGKAA